MTYQRYIQGVSFNWKRLQLYLLTSFYKNKARDCYLLSVSTHIFTYPGLFSPTIHIFFSFHLFLPIHLSSYSLQISIYLSVNLPIYLSLHLSIWQPLTISLNQLVIHSLSFSQSFTLDLSQSVIDSQSLSVSYSLSDSLLSPLLHIISQSLCVS